MENGVENGEMSGRVWGHLQQLKEEVTQELLDEGPLCHSQPDAGPDENALAAESDRIEWLHRSQLEARLRDITAAQDRVHNNTYGKCTDCGEQISAARLAVDPAVALCLGCQSTTEAEPVFSGL